MLAKLMQAPPVGDEWVHETKFDGYRIQARIAPGGVKLLTRGGLDWTARLGARLPAALSKLPCKNAVLDGEVIAADEAGAADFIRLAEHLSEGESGALIYCVFDLLFIDGVDLRAVPLTDRKARLRKLLGSRPRRGLHFSAHQSGDGASFLKKACKRKLEGIVSKLSQSPYVSARDGSWIKSKCIEEQEFVIVGFTHSTVLDKAIGALTLGVHERGKLRYAGRIGTGFTQKTSRMLYARLKPLQQGGPPFPGALSSRERRGVVWVKPALVVQVEFRAWTADGLVRHGAFKGLREDKPPREIVAERSGKKKK
ncbi:MAG TPA: non-homologous end-joining DNA ligase [Candidatus Binatia bacterium]|nr:non-homologous end-joining DNA ligase [Candidatus Binatia bacterium]